MTAKTITLILIGFLYSVHLFSQEEVYVDVLPTKISKDIKLLIPSGEYFIFERYHFFKNIYWINSTDTLVKLDNKFLQGKGITINSAEFSKKVDKCDSSVNRIRNSALDHKLFSQLDEIARMEIGYDNKEFKSTVSKARPTDQQVVALCHDDFKHLISRWYTSNTAKIDKIKEEKIHRKEEIFSSNDKIDKEFINSFLNDYGSCETDQTAILKLIETHTDEFLTVCKEMSDLSFYELKFSIQPENLVTIKEHEN
jgi:hypothetical protein